MKRFSKICYPVLTGFFTTFILSNSLLSGERASLRTGMVYRLLEGIYRLFFGREASLPQVFTLLVPKLGHFAEFFLFSLFLSLSVVAHGGEILKKAYPIFFYGLLLGVTDEFVQIFSSGRGSSVVDVWIDFSGVIAGYFFAVLLSFLSKRRKEKREKK